MNVWKYEIYFENNPSTWNKFHIFQASMCSVYYNYLTIRQRAGVIYEQYLVNEAQLS